MVTNDQRWALGALGALALSLVVVVSQRPAASNEWVKMPATMSQQSIASLPVVATPSSEASEPSVAQEDEMPALMSAIYIIPEDEGIGLKMAKLRM